MNIEELKQKVSNNLNEICNFYFDFLSMEDIFNIEKSRIYNLTEKETYILRKLGGLFTSGRKTSYQLLANELHVTVDSVKQMVNAIESKLLTNLQMIKEKNNDVVVNSESNSLENLGLHAVVESLLKKNGIFTIDDLLKLSYYDLLEITSSAYTIVEKVHLLGYNFTYEEINFANDMDNQKIELLDLQKNDYRVLKSNQINTIKDLLLLSVNDLKQIEGLDDFGIINILEGVDSYLVKMGYSLIPSDESKLEMNIENSELPKIYVDAIKDAGIYKLSDLLNLSKTELFSRIDLDEAHIYRLIVLLHLNGFRFGYEKAKDESLTLEDLNLSIREYRTLKRNGIYTMADVYKLIHERRKGNVIVLNETLRQNIINNIYTGHMVRKPRNNNDIITIYNATAKTIDEETKSLERTRI